MPNDSGGKPSARKTTKKTTAKKPSFSIPSTTRKRKTTSTRSSAKSKGVATAVATTTAATAATAAVTSAIKKTGGKTLAIILVCFILAIALGAGVCFLLGKNDKFDLVGNSELSFTLGETYTDEGVEIKEFGIDLSKKAIVETNLKKDANGAYYAPESGTYYIKYTVKSIKFGFVYPTQKVRLITFVEPSEGETDNG